MLEAGTTVPLIVDANALIKYSVEEVKPDTDALIVEPMSEPLVVVE